MSEDLEIATIEESFHFVGNVPVEMDRLKSLVTGAAIPNAVAFSILPKILSGPLDLEMLMFLSDLGPPPRAQYTLWTSQLLVTLLCHSRVVGDFPLRKHTLRYTDSITFIKHCSQLNND